MISKVYIIFFSVLTAISFSACETKPDDKDSQTEGTIAISVDETYKPIMEEQIKVFEARNPLAHINASYKPEADCIVDFLKDTTRLIFITRVLNDNERLECEKKKIPITRELTLARDAIAFIVGKGVKSEYTQFQLENILADSNAKMQIVFDNKNSSTVRYVTDSILKDKPLTKNTYAAKGGEEVIDYVTKNENAIGVIGVPWISDTSDSTAKEFTSKIDVIGILPFNDSITRFRKPAIHYIGLKEYPYLRELYFISKESWVGLGTGFVNYLAHDGQLVFAKSKLWPLRYNVNLRETNIKR
jgi:phosphate transport system substrate-binding protein